MVQGRGIEGMAWLAVKKIRGNERAVLVSLETRPRSKIRLELKLRSQIWRILVSDLRAKNRRGIRKGITRSGMIRTREKGCVGEGLAWVKRQLILG